MANHFHDFQVEKALTSPVPGTTLNLLKFPIMRPGNLSAHFRPELSLELIRTLTSPFPRTWCTLASCPQSSLSPGAKLAGCLSPELS